MLDVEGWAVGRSRTARFRASTGPAYDEADILRGPLRRSKSPNHIEGGIANNGKFGQLDRTPQRSVSTKAGLHYLGRISHRSIQTFPQGVEDLLGGAAHTASHHHALWVEQQGARQDVPGQLIKTRTQERGDPRHLLTNRRHIPHLPMSIAVTP